MKNHDLPYNSKSDTVLDSQLLFKCSSMLFYFFNK